MAFNWQENTNSQKSTYIPSSGMVLVSNKKIKFPKTFWLLLFCFLISLTLLMYNLSESGLINTPLDYYLGASNNPKQALEESKNLLSNSYTVNGKFEFEVIPEGNGLVKKSSFRLNNDFLQVVGKEDESLKTNWKTDNAKLASEFVPALGQQSFFLELYRQKNNTQVLARDDSKWYQGQSSDLPIRFLDWVDLTSQLRSQIISCSRDGGATINNIKVKKYSGRITDSKIFESIFPWLKVIETEMQIELYIGARDKFLYAITFKGTNNTKNYKIDLSGKVFFLNYGQSENIKPLSQEVFKQNLKTWTQQKGLAK